jgi:hypothetical protein
MGKTRTGMEYVVRRTLSQILEIQEIRGRAEGREECRRLLRETRVQKGL